MRKLINLILLIIFLSGVSCSNNNNIEINNNIFLQYLKETFNQKDVINEQMFIVIPCTGCAGCEQSVYSIFTDKLINNNDFTLIICNPKEKGLLLPTLDADNVKYDFLSKMADYDFGYGYPICIIVKDNVVVSRYTLTTDIIHWFVKYNSL